VSNNDVAILVQCQAREAQKNYKVTVKGAVVETGKFLSVSRKKDDKWHYVRDTWNADAPIATAAPAPAPTAQPAAKK
jgi:hypothetical protein